MRFAKSELGRKISAPSTQYFWILSSCEAQQPERQRKMGALALRLYFTNSVQTDIVTFPASFIKTRRGGEEGVCSMDNSAGSQHPSFWAGRWRRLWMIDGCADCSVPVLLIAFLHFS